MQEKIKLFEDTSPEAEVILLDLLRAAPPWRKLAMMEGLNATARMLMLAGLRQRHPQASEIELQRRLADLLLGPELAARAYGPISAGSDIGDGD